MQRSGAGREGRMAAIIGLDEGRLPELLVAARLHGIFGIANRNSPGQIVVSGERPAIEAAVEIGRELGAKRVLVLPVSVAGTYVFAAVLGLTWLATVPLTNSLVGQIFGVKYLSTLFSISFLGHQLGGIGQQVGPDLASVGDKSPQGLLTAILDPNKAVEARYINYVATTKSGLTLSGLLQSETSTSVSL